MRKGNYKVEGKNVYVERLSCKNGSLCTVWHKVCMENGFKLSEVIEIRKHLNNH